jgi:Ni2+-binding GTPase involved in maturation of urease and hydrogenase
MIIGFMGEKGCGKTYVANALAKKLHEKGIKTAHINFADKVKEYCAYVAGVSIKDLNTAAEKEKHRTLMQNIGMLFREKVNGQYWISQWLDTYSQLPYDTKAVVVSDVRFKNEAEFLRSRAEGAVLVKVERDTGNERDAHISENQWKEIPPDIVFSNTHASTEEFEAAIEKTFAFLLEPNARQL